MKEVISVGKAIPFLYKVNPAIFQILENEKLLNSMSASFKDERLDEDFWQKTFKRELLHVFKWAKLRSIIEKKYTDNADEKALQILSLLPSHALFSHITRRALLFAILGIKTEVAFKPDTQKLGGEMVLQIADFFSLHNFLSSKNASSMEKFKEYNKEGNIIMFTGKVSNAEMLKKVSKAKFYGATGCCLILLLDDESVLKNLTPHFAETYFENSCTNLKASILKKNQEYYNYNAITHNFEFISNIKEFIETLHPSSIYSTLDISDFYGYNVVKITDEGFVSNLSGFGKDPKFLFCGDYLI